MDVNYNTSILYFSKICTLSSNHLQCNILHKFSC